MEEENITFIRGCLMVVAVVLVVVVVMVVAGSQHPGVNEFEHLNDRVLITSDS